MNFGELFLEWVGDCTRNGQLDFDMIIVELVLYFCVLLAISKPISTGINVSHCVLFIVCWILCTVCNYCSRILLPCHI